MSIVNADADLFRTITEMLREQRDEGAAERRIDPRRPYPCVQLLAPFDGELLPRQEDFRQVRCQDLSSSGFSFLSYRRPPMRYVVVALGNVPFKFFVAEIMHVNSVDSESGHEFFVGCRFVRRLER